MKFFKYILWKKRMKNECYKSIKFFSPILVPRINFKYNFILTKLSKLSPHPYVMFFFTSSSYSYSRWRWCWCSGGEEKTKEKIQRNWILNSLFPVCFFFTFFLRAKERGEKNFIRKREQTFEIQKYADHPAQENTEKNIINN